MAITATAGLDPQVYEVHEDVTETGPDGRVTQIAVKGTALPMAQALALGLVKAPAAPGPTETKETAKPPKAPAPDGGTDHGPATPESAGA